MTLPVEAVTSVQSVVERAAMPSSDLHSLTDQFNRLMAQDPQALQYNDVQHLNQATPMTHFVQAQEEVMRQTFNDVRAFTAEAPSMDMHQMAARQIELSYQISMVQVQFNAGVYVAQSSKNGLQTLMKNQ